MAKTVKQHTTFSTRRLATAVKFSFLSLIFFTEQFHFYPSTNTLLSLDPLFLHSVYKVTKALCFSPIYTLPYSETALGGLFVKMVSLGYRRRSFLLYLFLFGLLFAELRICLSAKVTNVCISSDVQLIIFPYYFNVLWVFCYFFNFGRGWVAFRFMLSTWEAKLRKTQMRFVGKTIKCLPLSMVEGELDIGFILLFNLFEIHLLLSWLFGLSVTF